MSNPKLILENLSILIPSFDRRKILMQNLQFFDGVCKIFVCEDASKDLTTSERSQIPSNIEWIISREECEDRILTMAQKVETEFCCLMCDDEILIPESLAVLVSFLKDNQDFSCANGMAVGFAKNKNRKMWGSSLIFSHVYHELKQRSLCMEDAKTRALIHSSFYTLGSSYAVHRTSNFICAISNAQIAKNCARYSSEIAFELSHVLLGKSVVLPLVHWTRNYEVAAIRDTHPDKHEAGNLPTPFNEWWNNSENKKEKQLLVDRLATNIGQLSHLSESVLGGIIHESLSVVNAPRRLDQLARSIGAPMPRQDIEKWATRFDELLQLNNTIPNLDEEAIKKSLNEQGVLLPSAPSWKAVLKHMEKLMP